MSSNKAQGDIGKEGDLGDGSKSGFFVRSFILELLCALILPIVGFFYAPTWFAIVFASIVYGGGIIVGYGSVVRPIDTYESGFAQFFETYLPPVGALLVAIAKLTYHLTYEQFRRGIVEKYIPKNSVGCEIGVWKGEFTETLVNTCKPSKFHLVDPWKCFDEYPDAWFGGKCDGAQAGMDKIYNDVATQFASKISDGSIIMHRGLSTKVADAIPDESLDWVYIDGNHMYEFVKADLEIYTKKVRKGGIIFGDDFVCNIGWWGDGVTDAVLEFAKNGPVETLSLSNQFVLRKK